MALKVLKNQTVKTITILGEIGEGWFSDGYTLEKFYADLRDGEASEIQIVISSQGGDLFTALAIYDALRATKAKITADIVGATASAATVIAMAASTRRIGENAMLLVHQTWTQVGGNADELEKTVEELRIFDERIKNIYTSVVKKNPAELEALMKEERWLTAKEAIEWGFATELLPKVSNVKHITQLNVKPKNETNMDEKDQKIQELQTQLDSALAENEVLKQKIQELQEKIDQMEMEQATAEVENAIAAGKIDEKQKENLLALFRKDMKATKAIIDAMPVQNYQRPSNIVKQSAASDTWEQFKNDWKAGKFRSIEEMEKRLTNLKNR